MRSVGQRDKFFVQLTADCRLLFAQFFLFCFQGGCLRFGGLCLFAFTLFHEGTDLFGYAVLVGFHRVGLSLECATLLVESDDAVYTVFNILYVLDFQTGDNLVAMIFDIL